MAKQVKSLNTVTAADSPNFSPEEVKEIRKEFGFPLDFELLTPAQRKQRESSQRELECAENAARDARQKIENSYLDGAGKRAEYEIVIEYERGTLRRIQDAHSRLADRPVLQELLNAQLDSMASLLGNRTEVIMPEREPKPKRRRYRIANTSLRAQLEAELIFVDQCADALAKLPQNEVTLYHTHVLHPNQQTTYDKFRERAWTIRQELYIDEVATPTPLTGRQKVYKRGPSVQASRVIALGGYTPTKFERLLEHILSLSEKSSEQLQIAHELLPAIEKLRSDLRSRIAEIRMRKEMAKSDSTKRTPTGKQAGNIVNEQIVLELVLFHWKCTGQLQGVTHVAADECSGTPSACKCPHLEFIRVMYAKFPNFETPKDRAFERHINRAVGLIRDGNAALSYALFLTLLISMFPGHISSWR